MSIVRQTVKQLYVSFSGKCPCLEDVQSIYLLICFLKLNRIMCCDRRNCRCPHRIVASRSSRRLFQAYLEKKKKQHINYVLGVFTWSFNCFCNLLTLIMSSQSPGSIKFPNFKQILYMMMYQRFCGNLFVKSFTF